MAAHAKMPWCWARRFATEELLGELQGLEHRPSSFIASENDPSAYENYYSEALIAREPPGVPLAGGAYERACNLVAGFEFSDPRIVVGHFDLRRPLLGRPLLLELRALGFCYLAGVRITQLRQEHGADASVFGYRYETLEGHIERGAEWFLVSKQHAGGDVMFRIQASWRPGEFPNWWSRTGFHLVGRRYQRAWHRLSYLRLRRFLNSALLPRVPSRRQILRQGTPLDVAPIHSVAGREPPLEVTVERTS